MKLPHLLLLAMLALTGAAHAAERIKDIAAVIRGATRVA